MRSLSSIFLTLAVLITLSTASPFRHWNFYHDIDSSDYDFDDLEDDYARMQKRFLLGLGLTKNTPGKEYFSDGYKKTHKRQ
ncbi:unnamed protein product [Hymenolepis diminuta]|uniref:Neuropeptide-Like Protein n=1 Tax=Hymenolepis diminuta TaxID=6216 RepID=A0A0R3SPI3_HYMDI|nr:unnamed protein product [Hymenolepis diminuta]VUZ57697.1 unnamed protein product [Hymenolepis diminuta]